MRNICMWFRSDLRLIDNTALYHATKNDIDKVRACFFIQKEQWRQHGMGDNKVGFLIRQLESLQLGLHELNIALDILICENFESLPQVFVPYCKEYDIDHVFYNKEYEINEIKRDKRIDEEFSNIGIRSEAFDDQCLVPPGVILTQQHTPYTVFTPFKKTVYQFLHKTQLKVLPKPKKRKNPPSVFPSFNFDSYVKLTKTPIQNLWSVGEKKALEKLTSFSKNKVIFYSDKRDIPSEDATSTLSPYLASGTLSPRQCFIAAINQNKQHFDEGYAGIQTWIAELIWRDFYKHILYHFPDVCRHKNFNKKYDCIQWDNNPKYIQAWKEGKTGIPIVDAAMRQLIQTGWMHNRLRMVTAMFLTKNLMTDWRVGESFFAEHLIDFDFASNNGGWQWSASTGTDAAPYFRIFNPRTQAERFDLKGDFVKKYLPELANLQGKELHNPPQLDTYPKPIVDLSKSRQHAIDTFKKYLTGSEELK